MHSAAGCKFQQPNQTKLKMKNNTDTTSHPQITTNQIPQVLDRELRCGNKKPPLLLALYGLGKSYQAQKFASSNGMHYIDYRAAYKTFNDVRGFGVPEQESQKMVFYSDEDFDFATDKPNCLHFEEVLNAAPSVQKVLMQIILDRLIGKDPIPEDTFIMASSNRRCHRTGVEPILAALADRFSIYQVRPDFTSFMNYMENNAMSDMVLAFLNVNSDAPYNFDIGKWDGESNLPTFRSFERLDDLAASYRNTEEMANDDLLSALASSKVGPKYGPMFAQFVRLSNSIGDVNKMIEEADTCDIPHEADLRWIIACRLITASDKHNLANVLMLAHRLSEPTETDWMKNDDPSAMQTFVATSIRRRRQELLRTAEMLDWQQKFAVTLTTV